MNNIYLGPALFVFFLIFCSLARAEQEALVEVYPAHDYDEEYVNRSSDLGITFEINRLRYLPKDYQSMIDDVSYKDIFSGESINITQVELGLKYNTKAGSFFVSACYGTGVIYGAYLGDDRRLDIKKYTLDLGIILDKIFDEPYISPYGSLSGTRLDIVDESPLTTESRTIQPLLGAKLGILFQLNWIERSTSELAYKNFGLKNTFVDIFVAKNEDSSNSEDPIMTTDFDIGLGFKFEF